MATPEKLYFSTALEIGAGGLLCTAALLQNVTESLTGEPHNVVTSFNENRYHNTETISFSLFSVSINQKNVWPIGSKSAQYLKVMLNEYWTNK